MEVRISKVLLYYIILPRVEACDQTLISVKYILSHRHVHHSSVGLKWVWLVHTA